MARRARSLGARLAWDAGLRVSNPARELVQMRKLAPETDIGTSRTPPL